MATLVGLRGAALFVVSVLCVYFSAGLALGPAGRWVARVLGDASYGVYLLHPFVYMCARLFTNNPAALMVTTILLSILVAQASSRLFETPVRAWVRRRIESDKVRS